MSDTLFAGIATAPADPILSITGKYLADPRPEKVNLGVGAYLTEEGVTPVMDVVHEAETALAGARIPHTYIPISGLPGYAEAVQAMVFGAGSEVVQSGRACTVQSLGGTGALKLAMEFARTQLGSSVGVTSKPTWGNHNSLLAFAGYEVRGYRYYDKVNGGVDFAGMIEDLKALPARSLVVLHSCCHNPTGYDLSPEQWKAVIAVCQEKGLLPLLDMAYQGFGTGLEEDATAIRLFAASGMSFFIATSYSKSFNLYGERIGALTVVTQNAAEAAAVLSQAKSIVRAMYSNPPAYGARIVHYVLSNPERYARWVVELDAMRTRIQTMRRTLVAEMKAVGAKRDFGFVIEQKGMFSFTGFSAEQIETLAKDYGIYAVKNGRVCICGLTTKNVKYVARAFAEVM